MSCRAGGAARWQEHERQYSVTETRTHEKGFTEYRFISKKNPEDIKELVIWKRYSDFKKLHTDLSYIHRNLFRKMEEFPAFPKAHLFGRFETAVIEERRKGAENLLKFTVAVPALNNSPELKAFFRGGEVRRVADVAEAGGSQAPLPPPMLPEPSSPGKSAKLWQNSQILEDSSAGETCNMLPEPGDKKMEKQENIPLALEEEDLDLLFNCPEQAEEAQPGPLSHHELAVFDPCFTQDRESCSLSHEEELGSLVVEPVSKERLPDPELSLIQDPLCSLLVPPTEACTELAEASSSPEDYLVLAIKQIKQALEKEATADYKGAVQSYKDGVDILLKGIQGDSNEARREAVKRKTAEYLQHAETLIRLHPKATET
ncbi:sorting nexin-15 isoform X2 [Microcaecilia unicolor]|uniref:Sorting nexin-15 isoform X2 n=1 Tax=Microcaecilia unicolor TaxID=1415580 RepID=A0A6P7ZGG3_9AMPH|nr:sorting nexin-15 isoform X2 [Microcaecilia unicolor]